MEYNQNMKNKAGYFVSQIGLVKITLTGPQGSGKTMLAREIRKAARGLGLRIRVKVII